LLLQADVEDARRELREALGQLHRLDALDAFARTRRDWARPLN
jgi:hypothetical protein